MKPSTSSQEVPRALAGDYASIPRQLPPPPESGTTGTAVGGTTSSARVFYKTRLCVKFMNGCCPYRSCCFAHGQAELRVPAHNWWDHVDPSARRWDRDGMLGIGKVGAGRLCRRYSSGEECPYGDACTFLHERAPSHRVLVDATGRSRECYSMERRGRMRSGGGVGAAGAASPPPLPPAPSSGERRDGGPITKASLSRSVVVNAYAPYNLQGAQMKRNPLTGRKINGIYGDWLDGLSPSRVNNP